MTPKLQAILDKLRQPKADTQTATDVQVDSVEESPTIILVPSFDCSTEDEFSPYF